MVRMKKPFFFKWIATIIQLNFASLFIRRGLRVYEDPAFIRHVERTLEPAEFGCDRPWRHKFLMYSDEFFTENGLSVYETTQNKNDVILTDCLGFHWGLNLGFNLNCAKNFAPNYWVDYGLITDPCSCAWVGLCSVSEKKSIQDIIQIIYTYHFAPKN